MVRRAARGTVRIESLDTSDHRIDTPHVCQVAISAASRGQSGNVRRATLSCEFKGRMIGLGVGVGVGGDASAPVRDAQPSSIRGV